ncbi:ArsR/SmtB family transcription factor [Dactylosporangium siamense]|nr:helix-turn-helix domain-containing protein [Dactylosporangium siamense]
MRALAHPVRLALMDALAVSGPLTATEAGKLVGETPSACSFHLRQLAKYGFVEEAPERRGRNRPWRLVGLSAAISETSGDAERDALARGLVEALYQRTLDRLQRWTQTRHLYPREWRQATGFAETIWWVTPEELSAIDDKIDELLLLYPERSRDPALRPPGALPVQLAFFKFPLRPPVAEE